MTYNNCLDGHSLRPACREGCLMAIRRRDMQKSHPLTTHRLSISTHTTRCFLFRSHVRLLCRADPSNNRPLRLVDSSCSLTRSSQTSNCCAAKGDTKGEPNSRSSTLVRPSFSLSLVSSLIDMTIARCSPPSTAVQLFHASFAFTSANP